MRTFEESCAVVELWAKEKGIVANTKFQALKQLDKTNEEIQELREAISFYFMEDEELGVLEENLRKIKLEMGDVLVTLIVVATCLGVNLEECLDMAYEKIKNRTGRVVDGQFVKES